MIDPQSSLRCIVVEGSNSPGAAGEYVIDLAEYSAVSESQESVAYYQLKHSSTRTRKPFSFSEIRPTLKGFAERFSSVRRRADPQALPPTFCFVANRPVSARVKAAIAALARGEKAPKKIAANLRRATKLNGDALSAFCSGISFADNEGDYIVQKQKLRQEIRQLIAGFVDSPETLNLVDLVEDRALPKSEDGAVGGRIYPEDVLQRLGVDSPRHLFPAPSQIERLPDAIRREQHDDLLAAISRASEPLIVHAAGGVGKSVVACQLAESLPLGSLGIVYDCFGAGKYRNESEPRHRPYDAFLQIVNELAAKGLCRRLIASPATPRDALFRDFIERVTSATASLRAIHSSAMLAIFIDAADNAEMAAEENGDRCFAAPLLRESLPPGCKLVALCRTERVPLLKPSSRIRQLELRSFSEAETAQHLRRRHPGASDDDVREFHRLSGSNPRVQANALASRHDTVAELLSELGPTRTTVDEQIADQLSNAVSVIREQHTTLASGQVEAICRGLANLPPFIPLRVLATAANVEVSTIKSFVSELGRPLWHSDDSVQFRDEPTETWFRTQFSADPTTIGQYASLLEPLASQYTYVAKALPKLWLRAGEYDRLINLALSDGNLPTDNAIEARDIRVYRLQFAFKAALKVGRLADAARLAFRAGEEMAGNQRQLSLLTDNVDLVAQLQEPHRIQEYAYRRMLKGAWPGSESVYSAALLSSVADFRGEARGYLRAAERWLQLHFEERVRARTKNPHHEDELTRDDIQELAWAHLHLFGPSGVVKFLLSWKPPQVVFEVGSKLIRRLVDAARHDEVKQIARLAARNIHLTLAVANELLEAGNFPPKESLSRTLDRLASPKKRLPRPSHDMREESITPAIVAFAEACAWNRCSMRKICAVLDFYLPSTAIANLESEHRRYERRTFFRAECLRMVLTRKDESDWKRLLPSDPPKDDLQRQYKAETKQKLTQVIGALLPWYYARAKVLARRKAATIDLAAIGARSSAALSGRHLRHDPVPYELPSVHFDVLAFNRAATETQLAAFVQSVVAHPEAKFSLWERMHCLRVSHRLPHLSAVRAPLEQSCAGAIEGGTDDSPEDRSQSYISLARAVLASSPADAAAYFDSAIEAVSKFGDELLDRWGAVVAVARRAADGARHSEATYRFVRCAELVGETVAREKYWDRDDVFRVALLLDPAGAFAALSRWRDRDVGWFNRQVEALAAEAVTSGALSAFPTWSLSGFLGCNSSILFLKACLTAEDNAERRQRIFDTAINDFVLDGKLLSERANLRSIAAAAGVNDGGGLLCVELPAATEAPRDLSDAPLPTQFAEAPDGRIQEVLRGIDVLNPDGLKIAINAYDAVEFPKQPDRFWSEVVSRVPVGKENAFLRAITGNEDLDYFGARRIFGLVRDTWLTKAAVKKAWPAFVTAIGKQFAVEFSQRHSFWYWPESNPMTSDELEWLKTGMIEALADTPDMVSAGTFFGFVSTVAPRITSADALGVLDFSLTRFERHIKDEFGDGRWAEWLQAPSDTTDAFTGLIWSALGAPHSWVRWEAAHCVRRLAENDCKKEIGSLLAWMKTGGVGAFGSRRFPFYALHAQLYLLIGLARAAIDNVAAVHEHRDLFAAIALDGLPHVLIQSRAAKVALAIERTSPGAYVPDVVQRLRNVLTSPFPRRLVDRDTEHTLPRHSSEGASHQRQLQFGWDFDRYWFDPLAEVFGVSRAHVEGLAEEAARSFAQLGDAEHPDDPRRDQWRNLDYSTPNTQHDHGRYPRIDDFWFYYSYHGLLSASARLLQTLPVIKRTDHIFWDEGDRWGDWLERHILTRRDGRWLSDRRDPSPSKQRAWVSASDSREWRWCIEREDFLDVIANYNPLTNSIVVHGSWSDCKYDRVEHVTVSSALVRCEMANSLAVALRSTSDPYQVFMPSYKQDTDFSVAPFDLVGWIHSNGGCDSRLDNLDPYAREIAYPPDEVGDTFATLLRLRPDYEKRRWHKPNAEAPSAVCEIWSDKDITSRDEPSRGGHRIAATAELMQELCSAADRRLIICVKIRRDLEGRHRSERNDFGYPTSSHKVFIFSADGTLSDSTTSHRIG